MSQQSGLLAVDLTLVRYKETMTYPRQSNRASGLQVRQANRNWIAHRLRCAVRGRSYRNSLQQKHDTLNRVARALWPVCAMHMRHCSPPCWVGLAASNLTSLAGAAEEPPSEVSSDERRAGGRCNGGSRDRPLGFSKNACPLARKLASSQSGLVSGRRRQDGCLRARLCPRDCKDRAGENGPVVWVELGPPTFIPGPVLFRK
jgi:hypothetical protein